VDYLTSSMNPDRTPRIPPPVVLRGNPELVRRLIDSLAFKHKYTSGVLSFAEFPEAITPEMCERIMNDFEQVAFAGLEKDQYAVLWTQHTHAGRMELNFLVPRMELSTGKSLNIAPPGPTSRTLFDTFRSWVNSTYGLADPDDARRARDVSLPNHIARLKAYGARKGKALQEDIREAITERVKREVAAGRIIDQDGVVRFLKGEGFTLNRQGKDYISVIEPSGSMKIRLKGVSLLPSPF
jgi:Relaxase/Mobilisation nuclease domain